MVDDLKILGLGWKKEKEDEEEEEEGFGKEEVIDYGGVEKNEKVE